MAAPVLLITGASTGIGRVCAEHLHAAGCRVYAASRTLGGDTAAYATLRLDVTDDASVGEVVQHVVGAEGRIDVVINCAGIAFAGSVEDTTLEEARAQFETNFFGVYRVCRAVLPSMRAQRSGLIVNISSIAGVLAIPYQAVYSASKFAVEGLSEGLRMEVARYGVRVVLVEPGNFRTPITANRRWAAQSRRGSVYTADAERAVGIMAREEQAGPEPIAVARLIEHLIRTPRPRLRYRVGALSDRLAVTAKQVLPFGVYERALLQHYQIG